jgi:hypothetical protein
LSFFNFKIFYEFNRNNRWEKNIKMDLQEVGWGVRGAWTEFIWLRTGTGGELL